METNHEPVDRCAGCGLRVPGGTVGCQSIMDELLALHFSDVTYFGVHRLFVDTYCLSIRIDIAFRLSHWLRISSISVGHSNTEAVERSQTRRYGGGWSDILTSSNQHFPSIAEQ